MKFRLINKKDKAVFWTKDEFRLTEILKRIGIKEPVFVKDASIATTHLNKNLNEKQVKAFRYIVSKEIRQKEKQNIKTENLTVINGFKGNLINDFCFEYIK